MRTRVRIKNVEQFLNILSQIVPSLYAVLCCSMLCYAQISIDKSLLQYVIQDRVSRAQVHKKSGYGMEWYAWVGLVCCGMIWCISSMPWYNMVVTVRGVIRDVSWPWFYIHLSLSNQPVRMVLRNIRP